jgi:uncharacterized HAD superfamily protein
VDFDDVCVEFMLPMFDFHNKYYGTSCTYEQITTFELEKLFECGMDEKLRRIMEFYLSLEHESVTPVAGACEAMRDLCATYDLYMITARPGRVRPQTQKLLDKHFPGIFSDLHFTDHYFITDPSKRISKASICESLGATAFIDDAFHNAAEVARSGIPVYMLDKPWNRGKEHSGVTRVHSWQEILAHIKNYVPASP